MILDVVKRLAKSILDRIKTLLFNDHIYHLGEEFGLPTISPLKSHHVDKCHDGPRVSRNYAGRPFLEFSAFRDDQLGTLKRRHRRKARAAWAATHTTR